jgi:hypothetical protein
MLTWTITTTNAQIKTVRNISANIRWRGEILVSGLFAPVGYLRSHCAVSTGIEDISSLQL